MPGPTNAPARAAPRRVAVLLSLWTGACFHGDPLAYAPCDRSEPCREVGLAGCVRIADDDRPGFCAPACEPTCAPPEEGSAEAACVAVSGAEACALTCERERTFPAAM